MQSGIRNVIIAQVFLVAAAASIYFGWQGPGAGLAALFGGGIALLNSLLLAWRVRRADRVAPERVTAVMFIGAAQRFALTIAGFALGIAVLELEPVPLIIAFAVTQLGFVIAAKRQFP